ncbi:hypothetical protein Lal_00007671 [Lupinus albus]|uniref:Putative transcription factor interactor and regulator LIM family n=1 Tax=Lupinus albus TaxID=3870 RepID=A0A6A5MXP0_LUPAL|nr:putative transcription factor interactor and regulator LIM family [Lupinus albus]KAF1875055.1 hypothetical protein Lal_00007671 [Lupinus albus]
MAGYSKRHCLLKDDDGLVSLADTDVGYFCHYPYHYQHGFMSTALGYIYPIYSPTSSTFYDSRFEHHIPHFLQACFLCKNPLRNNTDIFMYKGDTPFCSEDCRQEQIDMDETKEKNRNLSSMKVMRKKEQNKSASTNKTQDYSFRTGAVAAA